MRVELKPFSHAGVRVSTESLEIPTYALGPDDANPPVPGRGLRSIYPYPWQKSFTTRLRPARYEAIVLSSPFIRATVLPDWGMHLYRAVDLVTGRDLFHLPAVFKPAHNALRGAYIAGGVEMNFPIGHTAVTLSRVGLALRPAAGGVQVLFHNIDRRSGMHCAAGFTLRGDCRGIVFDQYFHNPTPVPQPWYYWLNAGIAPDPSLRFLFPTEQMLGHFEGPFLESVSRYGYPRQGGRDYSRFTGIPEPIGLFSPVHQPGWFGAWYDAWNFGVVRWAAPWQAAGQKFWSWGNSEEGLLWGRIGGDTPLPVPEIQSGRPEMQMDRGVLAPFASTGHREWWMPVSQIGDVQGASPFGAMAVTLDRGRARVGLCPATPLRGGRIALDGRRVGKAFDLTAGKAVEFVLPTRGPVKQVDLVGPEGAVLSVSAKSPPPAANVVTLYDNPRPLARLGAEALTLRGERYGRMMRPDLAGRFYRLALRKDPCYSRAHVGLGLLELNRHDAAAARRHFLRALEDNRWSDQALYLHGLACLWSGDEEHALADFHRVAATGAEYALPALVELARHARRKGEFARCRQIIDDGLDRQPNNPAMLALRMMEHRRQGQLKAAAADGDALDRLLGYSPLAHHERSFAGAREPWVHIPYLDGDVDARLAAVAMEYRESGGDADAAKLLARTRTPEGKTRAAYLLQSMGKRLRRRTGAARFWAWGRPDRLALQTSLRERPDDATARFAMGCLFAEEGHLEQAAEHLQFASRHSPRDSIALVALGSVQLAAGKAGPAAATLQAATRAHPANATAWVRLDAALRAAGRRNLAWLRRFSAAPAAVLDDEEARQALARLACDLGRYEAAARLLAGRQFHPYELSHDLRNLWSEIHRRMAIREALAGDFAVARRSVQTALEYPPRFNLGRPCRRFDARTLYTAACIAQAQGSLAAARENFMLAAEEDQPGPTLAKPWSILAQLCLGQTVPARRRLARLQSETQTLLDADFAPDLRPALEQILALCRRIRRGYRPGLRQLAANPGDAP